MNPTVRILDLSMHEDEPTIQTMRQSGAVDYNSKSSSARELGGAIWVSCQSYSSIIDALKMTRQAEVMW
jgi:DNA-binding NarL/FixJ family response regulator